MKIRLHSTLLLLGLTGLAFSQDSKLHWSPLTLGTFSVYTKVKSNFLGKWQQETGFSGKLATMGRITLNGNIAYLLTYPFDSPFPAQYTAGLTLGYRLSKSPFAPSIYTKIKSNFVGNWQQETGVSALLYKAGRLGVATNVAYVFRHPFESEAKPGYTAGLTFSYALH